MINKQVQILLLRSQQQIIVLRLFVLVKDKQWR